MWINSSMLKPVLMVQLTEAGNKAPNAWLKLISHLLLLGKVLAVPTNSKWCYSDCKCLCYAESSWKIVSFRVCAAEINV
ncbi:hypothetical protein VNO77_30008 [Canavalia gladiata]|uniref:Uncharacterized protein n=1 Tax=Canavalia gladiata TaxID=3824 RepID=A0AAN9KP19_CANGL